MQTYTVIKTLAFLLSAVLLISMTKENDNHYVIYGDIFISQTDNRKIDASVYLISESKSRLDTIGLDHVELSNRYRFELPIDKFDGYVKRHNVRKLMISAVLDTPISEKLTPNQHIINLKKGSNGLSYLFENPRVPYYFIFKE